MVDVVQRNGVRIRFRGDDVDLAEFVEPVSDRLRTDRRLDPSTELLDRKERPLGLEHDLDDVLLREFLVECRIDPIVDPRWEGRHRWSIHRGVVN